MTTDPVDETRRVVAHAMTTLAVALTAAAALIFVGMFVVYLNGRQVDWPGRYWFAVLPMLLAALVMRRGATAICPESRVAAWLGSRPDQPLG